MIKPAIRLLATFVIATAVLFGSSAAHVFADAPKYDVKEADFVAHLMVLSPEELPGNGWDTTKTDEFDDDSNIPDTQACKDSALKLKTMDKKIEPSRAGRAKVEITRDAGAGVPTSVESSVEVYKTADALNGYVDASKPLFLSNAFTDCLKSTLQDATGDDKLSVKSVEPSSAAPGNGFAKAVEVTFPSINTTMRFEFYGWSDSNALVSLSFTGTPSQVKSSLIDQAIMSTQMSMAIVGELSSQ